MTAPKVCDWPAFPEAHAGDVEPVVVTDVLELGVKAGEVELKHLCSAHAGRLNVELDLEDPAEVLVPTWVLDELLRVKWPIDSPGFPELLAARSRARSAPVGPETGSTRRPPWCLTSKAFAYLSELVSGRGMQGAAELDQLRATIREELDKLEIGLTDEWSVYHGLVWTGLLTELARNGLANGAIAFETYEAIAEITTTIGAALMEYAPEGVKPR